MVHSEPYFKLATCMINPFDTSFWHQQDVRM